MHNVLWILVMRRNQGIAGSEAIPCNVCDIRGKKGGSKSKLLNSDKGGDGRDTHKRLNKQDKQKGVYTRKNIKVKPIHHQKHQPVKQRLCLHHISSSDSMLIERLIPFPQICHIAYFYQILEIIQLQVEFGLLSQSLIYISGRGDDVRILKLAIHMQKFVIKSQRKAHLYNILAVS